jgi:hypothetical protein
MKAPSTASKLMLVLFGSVCGTGLLGTVLLVVSLVRNDQATHFESLDDLRARMTQRDSRDIKTDGSVSLRSIIQPHPSDELIYTLRPNLDTKFQGVALITNSFGMRNPEVKIAAEPGVYRVAVLGDSFTFGWGVEESECFVRKTEKLLNDALGSHTTNPKVEMLNFGVPGYSTFQEVAQYDELVAQFKPNAVLIYFIENDFGLPFFISSGTSLQDSVSWVRAVYRSKDDTIAQQHSDIIRKADANRALLRFDERLFEEGVDLTVVFNPGKNESAMRKKLWALRKPHHFSKVRLLPALRAMIEERGIDAKDLRLPTDPHPSALKHTLLAESLSKKLLKLFFHSTRQN